MADINGLRLYPEGAISAIADAIRTVGGGTSTYKVSQMATAISNLSVATSDPATQLINKTLSGTLNIPSSVSTIGLYAFCYCNSLTSVNASANISVDSYGFASCSNLTSANLPHCLTLATYAFRGCLKLREATFPECSYVGAGAFYSCKSMVTASFNASYIGNSAFYSCYNLLSLYLTSTSVCSLAGTNAFTSTPISTYTVSTGGMQGSIFVPLSLLSAYKSSTNWAAYSNRMVGI